MNVQFFERKPFNGQISIEKLFSVIRSQLNDFGVQTNSFKNPYALKGMLKSFWYFYKNQGDINHITGDIHWVALVLNPKRTVLTIHDLVGLQYLKGIRKKIYYYLWIYWPIRRLKYITVISEKTKKEIVELLPWAAQKIVVIPNCLTIPFSKDFKKNNNSISKFLIIGTRANKNVDRAIQALKGIKGVLNIVGEITPEQKVFLETNNIDYDIHVNVNETKLIEFYKESDILLFPSFYEGFGLPIIEAQAYQCAVITSNISPMKEVAGEGAILVNPYQINEITEAIVKLQNDTVFKEELIKKGLMNVKNYEPKAIAILYLNLYQKILQENDFN
ncbi:glycosyltransferase family 4 protein [Flavobacterium luminosum]|uniref:Glycosyltransferase family 4 protein n=1 Tax=Flavobacterium luminosum TaxID=2949086 RepID=A0ABT0TNP7_9FLAO|nr:glycosyltransferase family 1 protein [Flavobacterium sp. HXWNR70]MCL9809119.1 glycosyltransferase family 4 protein [Flavobacterium sp. HXWNR70]